MCVFKEKFLASTFLSVGKMKMNPKINENTFYSHAFRALLTENKHAWKFRRLFFLLVHSNTAAKNS